jgi:hypothetical protein
MSKRHAYLAVAAALTSFAHADWNLSSYPTVTDNPATTDTVYGIQSYSNKSSSVAVTVPGGYVNLAATKLASEGTEGYSANVGLLHPLTPEWTENDLTGLTGVRFEYQNTTKITDVLAVSFGSGSYTKAIADAGTVYEATLSSATELAPTTGSTWKTAELYVLDFATPSWWTKPADFPSIDSVLKRVKNLQFAPKTLYSAPGAQGGTPCKSCVTPTMTSQNLKLRNITLLGVEPPGQGVVWNINREGFGCVDATKKFAFDDFRTGSAKNTVGGDWFAYSDFDSIGTSLDPAKGKSIVTETIVQGDDAASSYIQLNAQLRKLDGATYHKYAGWADIGTNFPKGAHADATGMTAIGFTIQTLEFDFDRVASIDFKVKTTDVADTAVHFISLPARAIAAAGAAGRFACIRPGDLKQASWVTTPVAFDPSKISQISWEVKILDNKTASIDTATANFLVSDVNFYGISDLPTAIRKRSAQAGFSAIYTHEGLNLKGFEGLGALEVANVEGRWIASVTPSARVKLSLPRGTYILSSKRANLTTKFTVIDR